MSTTTERVVAGQLVPPRRKTCALSTLASAVLHGLLLVVLAATSVRIAAPARDIIPLVIRNPAPPPPPPGGGPAEGTSMVPAPVQPVPVEEPKKILPKAVPEKPKKIAAKRPPSVPPVEPSPVAAAPAAAPEGGQAGGGVMGGVEGGVRGGSVGSVGGKLGGRLGGTGDDVFSADQVAVPPKLVHSVVPDYPVIARARGLQGVVVLQGIIDRSGDVEGTGLTVLQSYPPFDDAAIKAFRQWRFTPGRNDGGEAVRVVVRQPIRFQLR